MAFPPLGNSDHVGVSVSIDTLSYSKRDALFHCIFCDYHCADQDGLCDHLRDVSRENTFKPGASAAACEFCELVQVEIDVHMPPYGKYQVKPYSSSSPCCCHNS